MRHSATNGHGFTRMGRSRLRRGQPLETKAEKLQAALEVLGKRIVVAVEDAA